ncbi:putative helicase [Flavobacterium arsenatis]|uniref:site-specific DNA-methyltransferase (adenine-specific) n=1 Tax=Flavobacterium arsenatis TaxID=1484332 RepID=A0ABU1TJM4_9FLAO|nr:type ISP restriction/modification enzyme [Flavobacterium arsenatis]MDR6966125.1 putative helicase [Flavobacterium arsenatis]
MTLQQYISKLNILYQTGNAREHSYRGDLQNLFMAIVPDVLVTNEPARVACGAPDYVFTRKDVPVGYVEAKDIGFELNSKSFKEQFDRYKAGLSNLIFTDYMDFHFYKDGNLVTKVAVAKLENNQIVALPDNFNTFTELIKNFTVQVTQTIKSPTKLAQMMAGKAKLMADVIEKSLNNDDANQIRSSIKSQMLSFQQMLIHDIDNKSFADIYAQTIAYGMFAARYHDPTLPTFSRQEAAELIPKSNPFLRKLFQDIAGYDLDSRLVWIVEELVSIFLASDVAKIMKNFGKSTKQEDPVVHFYETFLGEYNPALRKARGVWYTPQPVVNFIVRAVDDILKTEFDLKDGLANTSKIKIKKKAVTQTLGKNAKIKEVETEVEVHKVQILDPATGTGTFLAEVVRHIHKKFEGQQGIWSKYVTNDLIPRLNGFELLMASYAMAHLKMDMLLTETGYKPTDDQRFRIFLTNSLEEAHPDTQTLFSSWLSDEADQANAIKRDAPVMVVMGNPPYSVSSSNKSEWIQNLIKDYKKDLNERKINLDDDYIKFTRFGQHFIDKNGSGILAYISNNSFIDGVTHRQMRKNLLESFDKIYILDLHGFSKLKEINLVATNDENVFDIQQGVSINIFVKTGKKTNKELATIKYFEQYGKRIEKYNFLNENHINKIDWITLDPIKPYFFFVKKDFSEEENYRYGFEVNDLFINSNSGIKTDRDSLFYDSNKDNLQNRFNTLLSNDFNKSFTDQYNIYDSGSYKITSVIKNKLFDSKFIKKTIYRPFDSQWTYYDPIIISRPAQKAMIHLNEKDNNGLILGRQGQVIGHMQWNLIFCTNTLSDYNVFYRGGGYVFPLYIYPETTTQQSLLNEVIRTPNLNMEIVNKIATDLGMEFAPEKADYSIQTEETNQLTPIDILDYIYAVLHSPSYREKYKEFLKIDFPRVPYPKNKREFIDLVGLGSQLRQIHLLESDIVEQYITQYPEDGDNVVGKVIAKNEAITDIESVLLNVYINDTQYFKGVPENVWNFYIGGYQPAQKWLKDRKGRELSYEDILHYQKMIVALSETGRIMGEIDGITL